MLATIHPLPLPARQDPAAAAPAAPRDLASAAAQSALAPAGAAPPEVSRFEPVPPELVPPESSLRLRRVPRWPSALPRLVRASPKPSGDEALQSSRMLAEAPRTRRRELARLRGDDRGAVTAEYAVVILAAVAFAGLLVAILRSDEVRAMLLQLVQNALGSAG